MLHLCIICKKRAHLPLNKSNNGATVGEKNTKLLMFFLYAVKFTTMYDRLDRHANQSQ